MAGCQRCHQADSGNNITNQEHDLHDVILEGLGEQIHQVQERLEHLEAASCEVPHQEVVGHAATGSDDFGHQVASGAATGCNDFGCQAAHHGTTGYLKVLILINLISLVCSK